ncbi:DoxX family protein [Nocardioides sp.]|uniref:DoxX family protein n=1 Tax=Nocardioides sp. TaxID=35761 RepID=UPI002BABFE0D|nr:DoxX family protein [Nocardioides sp.]HSX66857.1 DoxX family protein [Nocardioides sp.]
MNLLHPLPAPIADLGLLAARVLTGTVLIAHGWQKLHTYTLSGTAASFNDMGVPNARAAATYAAIAELAGGALLVIGLLAPVAALLVVLDMAGAFWFVHRDAGVFVAEGGWELVAVITAAAIAITAVGYGRVSVDHALIGALDRRANA